MTMRFNEHSRPRRLLPSAIMMTTLAVGLAWTSEAAAETQRRGIQVEGMIGGAACLPGRAPCRQEGLTFDGRTRPSFATGAALGFRPFKWLMVGGLYRLGMLNPDYRVDAGSSYRWAAQHTFAVMMRPILPIWRFDLGLNIAPGYGRQVFRMRDGSDRDVSQGFSFLFGPTVDVYVARRLFVGAEVDFILNTQKKVCERREGATTCTTTPERRITPTHQVLFGLHAGMTFG